MLFIKYDFDVFVYYLTLHITKHVITLHSVD